MSGISRASVSFLRSIYYLGNRFKCPCCGWKFRKMREYGVKKRKNARCPRCGSLERHRLLWLFLKNETEIEEGGFRILHVAPEQTIKKRLAVISNIDYTSIDIAEGRAMMKMDITNLEFSNDTFDVILCNHVLEHVENDRKAMSELLRVLKKGGWAILQVPISGEFTHEDDSIVDPLDREKNFGQHDHVRLYGKDYKNRLESAGFKATVINYCDILGKSEADRYSLMENEEIYYCEKQ